MTRTTWVGGNWKCNGTNASIEELAKSFNAVVFDEKKTDVVICPTSLHICKARQCLDKKINVGCQNMSRTEEGAFTGEVSASMLKDFGLNTVLIGHSERRQLYHETDEAVADKVALAQKHGLNAIICIGESLEERKANKIMEVLKRQVLAVLGKITNWDTVVIAYEPIWAIGTGVVATPEQAQEAHAEVRKLLKENVSQAVADKTRIVYGGSVNEKNCAELIKAADIDGFLVGGASLKPSFVDIITAANK
eukprot:GHVO01027213.1.p1 GENE.GHVO01027213.1~~GHVO01027213.1.p1  ORF type:complete len:270 (+),score=48.15 GHVO01027213.1:63-812(+)